MTERCVPKTHLMILISSKMSLISTRSQISSLISSNFASILALFSSLSSLSQSSERPSEFFRNELKSFTSSLPYIDFRLWCAPYEVKTADPLTTRAIELPKHGRNWSISSPWHRSSALEQTTTMRETRSAVHLIGCRCLLSTLRSNLSTYFGLTPSPSGKLEMIRSRHFLSLGMIHNHSWSTIRILCSCRGGLSVLSAHRDITWSLSLSSVLASMW